MDRTARYLALATCLAVTGSIAHAAPASKAKRRAKAEPAAHAMRKGVRKAAPPARKQHGDEVDIELDDAFGRKPDAPRVAFATQDDGVDAPGASDVTDDDHDDTVDAPIRLHRPAYVLQHDWHFALGPNAWLSSVDATVNLGSKSVSSGSSFFQLEHHVRYGIPVLAEARYGRFSLVTDLTYGVIGLDGGADVGPVMVTLAGAASSLMVDSIAGVRLVGDEQSPVALEARGGVRYQRTAVDAAVGVGGPAGTSYGLVNDTLDALAGARAFVRPASWIYASASGDVGVVGSSKTWSAEADANVRIASRVLLSLGYRTMTMDSSFLNMTMHGPRASVQATF